MSVETKPQPPSRPDFLFHALMRAHFNAQMASLSQRGLPNIGSPKILFALMELSERGEPAPSQKELADLLRISPATIANSLRSLERSGFVTRQADEQDSRRNRIFISEKGLSSMRTIREAFDAVDNYMFHGFTREERDQVYALHTRMLNNLYQIGGKEDFCCPPPPPPPDPFRKDG